MIATSRSTRGRRRWMALGVLLVVSMLEMATIVAMGKAIGAVPTLLVLVAESLLGGWLIKHEGSRAWRALRSALESGHMPSREIADGALVLVGGALLLVPGFFSDIVGLFCVLPFTRPLVRRFVQRTLERKLQIASETTGTPTTRGPNGSDTTMPGSAGHSRASSEVVEGEIVEE